MMVWMEYLTLNQTESLEHWSLAPCEALAQGESLQSCESTLGSPLVVGFLHLRVVFVNGVGPL